jgi:hypothetical protein
MIDSLNAVLTPDRDDRGRFAPGNNAGVGHGRPRRSQEEAMLAAIKSSMPPERIEATIAEALEIARATNSWRGIMAVVEFAASYSLGKPIARIEQGSGGIRDIMAELGIEIDD